MNHEIVVAQLKAYEKKLSEIAGRFRKSRDRIYCAEGDDLLFEQAVIELRDLYNDAFGQNTYAAMTVQAYNEGVSNFTGSPSLHSIGRVRGILSSAISRLERNPDLLASPPAEDPAQPEPLPLEVPSTVTLRWLANHVPLSIWAALLSLLFASFSLGVTATAKLSFVQEWVGLKNTDRDQNVAP